jgi:L-aspartate oxidase
VVRDAQGLSRLLDEIDALEADHSRAASLVAARLIAACALSRRESRGAHFRSDAPEASDPPLRTFVTLAEVDAAQKLAAE